MPTLYVAFPVFNPDPPEIKAFIEELEAVKELLGRLGYRLQCLAVDDASSEPLTKVLGLKRSTKFLSVLRQRQNQGCADGLRTALGEVSHRSQNANDLFAWLDSDGEHRPWHLLEMVLRLQRGQADGAVTQIVWREQHMKEFDRNLQLAFGAMEGYVIFGADSGQRWLQHCPGYWLTRGPRHWSDDGNHPYQLYARYLDAYEQKYGERARWGEDMTMIRCIVAAGGVVDNSVVVQSHMVAPGRTLKKVLMQYTGALRHLVLYEEFFARIAGSPP
jgi:hypothetical protein